MNVVRYSFLLMCYKKILVVEMLINRLSKWIKNGNRVLVNKIFRFYLNVVNLFVLFRVKS